MLPLGEEVEVRRRVPIATIALIALNVLVWLPMGPGHEDVAKSAAEQFGLVPARLDADTTWTLLTYAFLHANLLHLGTNMLFLWVFGRGLEHELGSWFLPFYLVCAAAAGGASVAARWGASTPAIGASGAVSGILGAYLILLPNSSIRSLVMLPPFWVFAYLRGDRITWDVPAWAVIATWFVLQIAETAAAARDATAAHVDHAAHFGGFIVGFLIIRLARAWLGLWPDEPEYERVLDRPVVKMRGTPLPDSYMRANRLIAAGEPIRLEDLEWVARGGGYVDPDAIPGYEGRSLIGRRLRQTRYRYEPIRWEDVEPLPEGVALPEARSS